MEIGKWKFPTCVPTLLIYARRNTYSSLNFAHWRCETLWVVLHYSHLGLTEWGGAKIPVFHKVLLECWSFLLLCIRNHWTCPKVFWWKSSTCGRLIVKYTLKNCINLCGSQTFDHSTTRCPRFICQPCLRLWALICHFGLLEENGWRPKRRSNTQMMTKKDFMWTEFWLSSGSGLKQDQRGLLCLL